MTLFVIVDIFLFQTFKSEQSESPYQQIVIQEKPDSSIDIIEPVNYDIDVPVPPYQEYGGMVEQLKRWHKEAPELTEVGVYGQSSQGQDLYYIRINNVQISEDDKLITLIHSTTHGNEAWAGCTVMAYVGTILDQYGDDKQITELVDSRDMYFIPIVSPDSHPDSRYVDGVDPNRDYPTQQSPSKQSVVPIQALRDFSLAINPRAVASGHTWGEVYLYPWGDSERETANEDEYNRILGEMRRLSGYGVKKASDIYGRPIYGCDMDWYHRQGSFSIVIEYGTHQRPPSEAQIQSSFEKTFGAILYFLEEAPEIEIKQYVVDSWRFAA